MEAKGEISDTSFTSVVELSQKCQHNIPEQYILPPSQRPNPSLVDNISTSLPVIDLSMMNHPTDRSQVIDKVYAACNQLGFFQVINHGIPTMVMKDALDFAEEFFDLPSDEKMCFASIDVHKHDDIKEGSQVMAVNCYPCCPEPDLALGMPPHTDYGTLTILNQSHQGLEIMDHDKNRHPVPFIEGALIVQLGDQFEVISNGGYKSIPHRAILNVQRKRLSIASIHSMHLDKKVGPAPEVVDEQHPVAYKEGSFGGFLTYISAKSLTEGKYIDTLKIHERSNLSGV